jgi:hypothetical protein
MLSQRVLGMTGCYKIRILARWVRHCRFMVVFLMPWLALFSEVGAQDFTYTNNNGAATITGYTGPGGNVTIPSTIAGLPVTSIGGEVFLLRMDLTSVTIPDSVTKIEDGGLDRLGGSFGTFAACTGLTNVAIGKGVCTLGVVPSMAAAA